MSLEQIIYKVTASFVKNVLLKQMSREQMLL